MADRNATDFLNLRLPLYAYAAPLWQGRRVLEVGCGDGGSADYLGGAGAGSVVSVDVDATRVDRARVRHTRARVEFRTVDLLALESLGGRFDVILVPDGAAVISTPGLLPRLGALLTDGGHLIVAVPAADRKSRPAREGVGYYDLFDPLAAAFPVVRMLGQTPFLGFGLVEFDGTPDALRVDVSLLHGGSEQPSHYVAVAGATAPPALGYALVQVPFGPVEAILAGATTPAVTPPALTPTVDAAAAEARVEMAERRLDEAERRGRARLEEAETRLADLRRKLDDALVQSESAVRVARAQGEEIEELRARVRRMVEDREATDADMSKLRRALSQADESVLTLTRRTAEEMAVVAEKLVGGLTQVTAVAGAGVAPAATGSTAAAVAEAEARAKRAEETVARERAEIATLTQRLRESSEQVNALRPKVAGLAERDDRIARLEGDKQDLVWRVAELEEKLRHAASDLTTSPAADDEVAALRAARDRAIEQFHRGAAAHANEVHQLQSSVAEQAALVAELEDGLRAAEARAAAADKEATTLRRNAKELEEADRARRARLAELEGKLLRLERERAQAASAQQAEGGGAEAAEAAARAAAAEQRALIAEQRAQGLAERLAALNAATQAAPVAPAPVAAGASNGHAAAEAVVSAEIQQAVAELETRLREEMATLTGIEDSLARAREEAARGAGRGGLDPSVRADLERALAAKDSQLIEGRLELARLRRDSEARQQQLEREISDLRSRLDPGGGSALSEEHSQGAQLILMHSTLANIRRRSARLRDELEGFRRRLDTLPPGALSSMLEEIGEDLAEFAK